MPDGAVSVRVEDSRRALSTIARNFYENPQEGLKLIGVTGTNGKTTVVRMIGHVLDGLGIVNAVLGTVGHVIAGTHIDATHTTPSALELWRLLALAKDKGVEVVAMEVSSHALEMERVFGLEFDVSVFTNLTQDHLDFHKTMEAYFAAKSRLFTRFTKGVSVVNCDDEYGQRLVGMVQRTVSYGVDGDHSYAAQVCSMDARGLRLVVRHQRGRAELDSPLVGLHNAYNLLAALGALAELGAASFAEIASHLATFEGVKGRLERVDTGDLGFSVFIDYAHTPHALESVIKALLPVTEGRLWVVFGCGGDRDRGKRPQMGAIATAFAHRVVVTSDNPRSEEPEAIIEDILKGVEKREGVIVEPDRKKAIHYAIVNAQPGDVVLIAGKGHETYQIFADRTIHFDDAEVAERAVEERLKGS